MAAQIHSYVTFYFPFFFFFFFTVPVPVTRSQWMLLTVTEKTGAFTKTFLINLYRNWRGIIILIVDIFFFWQTAKLPGFQCPNFYTLIDKI